MAKIQSRRVDGGETRYPAVLAIDNEDTILDVLEDVLHEEGYEVYRANGSKDALRILAESGQRIGVVLLAYVLEPSPEGLSCEEHLADMMTSLKASCPGVRVIVMSAWNVNETSQLARESGAFAFCRKPFPISELMMLVEAALTEHKM